jgi:hypothetical protein
MCNLKYNKDFFMNKLTHSYNARTFLYPCLMEMMNRCYVIFCVFCVHLDTLLKIKLIGVSSDHTLIFNLVEASASKPSLSCCEGAI